MKKMLCLLLVTCCFAGMLNAQNFLHEFGKFSQEEFDLKNYAKDTTAEAVVLYDIGKSFFQLYDNGYRLVFEHKTKLKIFKKSGFKFAQFEVPYYVENAQMEMIDKMAGNTYNLENGKLRITPLDPKTIFDEKTSDNWRRKKIALPDVKEGSVVEFTYTIVSPYFFNFQRWEFQKPIPVIYSEYTTRMIPFYEYVYILQGVSKLDSYKTYVDKSASQSFYGITYNDVVYEFTMKDVPAFRDESFITSSEDFIAMLDFQLATIHYPTGDTKQIMSEWPVMVKEFADHTDFGGFMKRAQGKTDKLVESLNLGGKSTMEKIRAVDQYIKSNYNWDKHTGKFVNQSIKDFMKNKVGNVAEINLFYAALLNNLGVNANPVLLSTRDHGKIKSQYPFQHFFNYVVVAVNLDGETMLLDGTEPLSACGELPVRCINDKGLLIQKEKTNNAVWVPINSRGDSGMEYKIHIRPMATPDSTFIDFQINSTGYDATRLRRLYLNDEKELRNELDLKTYNLRNPLKGENERSPDKSFLISGIAKTALEVVEDKIIVSPFCNFIPTENPLKQTLRSYPVDMIYKKGRTFETIIDLPKGYQMMNKPTTIDLSNQEVDIQYAVTQLNESSIQVKGTYRFKRDVYGASSYPDLKRYFNSIVDKLNDRIILIKKP